MSEQEMETNSTEQEDDDEEEKMENEEDVSDESDSDSGDDEKENAKITELESQVAANPYLYDKHVELIQLCSTSGELDKLRAARERMSEVFPLTEELWLAWVRDEIKVSEDREDVKKLFERAVKDYLNLNVWLEYVQYSIGEMGQDGGTQRVRDVFERALTACGLHPVLGNTIWEAYREFENALLASLQPTPGSVATPEQLKQIESQTKRTDGLFRRQLCVPLIEMRTTYEEYKEWCSDDVPSSVTQNYESAKTKMEVRMKYEDTLLVTESPKLEAYNKYIDYELTQGEPARVQCIFERAIQDNCLIPDLWYKYTKFLDKHLQLPDVVLGVHQRAVQNCPWSADLWLNYCRARERCQVDHDKIIATFESALNCGDFANSEDKTSLYNIWMAYCDYMRRRINWNEEHKKELEDLRQLFDRAAKHLYECYADPECAVLKYQARLEAKFCKNMEKARELWNVVMQSGFGSQAVVWLEYFNLERSFGDHKHCRKILQRALNSVSDWPESICEAFISFEREEGTLDQYDVAVERCESQLERIKERRKQAEEKEAALQKSKGRIDRQGGKDKKGGKEKRVPQDRNGRQSKQETNKGSQESAKWSKELDTGQIQPYVKKRKAEDSNTTSEPSAAKTDGDGFKIPSVLPPTSAGKKRAPPPGFKAKSSAPPPGFKGASDETSDSEPPAKKMKESDIKDETPPTHDTSNYNKSVFVSNLDFNVEEDQLEQIFSSAGDVKEIRLIRRMGGKSKGYAYVEFDDEESAKKALAMDRKPVKKRPMYVSVCEEKTEDSASDKFKFATNMEKNKLFVKGLPFKVTKEEIQKLFEQHGKVKDIRLVTHKSGAPKGLAYVEYESEAEASQAIMKTDNTEMDGHAISVAISNPPPRKAPLKQRDSSSFTPSLGGGKRDTARGGRARTQLAMVPRNIKSASSAVPSATPSAASTSDSTSSESSSKMSNADFRKMLLKK